MGHSPRHPLARTLPILLALGACAGPPPPAGEAAGDAALDTVKGKASYGMGLNLGRKFEDEEVELDLDLLARGIRDGYTGATPAISEETTYAAIVTAQEEARRRKAASNQAEGEAFLSRNGARPEVVTRPSGLQYEVLEEGGGTQPSAEDTVVVHYVGALVDGRVFENTYERGEPSTVPLSEVIPGWAEALPLMKAGARWRLYVPPQLAWGEAGSGPDIGPNETLVFEIELLAVQSG